MSLLEVITKASANSHQIPSDSNYPIILNPDPILRKLKPQIQHSNDTSLVKRWSDLVCFGAGIVLELWEILETLIVHGFVEYSCFSNLIHNLIEKRRSDLVCLCVKHVSDLQASDLLAILKYFLSPPKDAYSTMANVRKEWEGAALSAIEKATDKSLGGSLAKDASILLYDSA